jgi:peptidoglycan L-alanyl-D-glutamate endopeptidase CwlK
MSGINMDLRRVADRAIQITKVDFGIPDTGGLRDAEIQNWLFKSGKSNCDGYEKLSNHQSGNALDFYAYVDGKASWDEGHLAQVAAAFLQASIELGIPIKWGGLFKSFKDYPHVELM